MRFERRIVRIAFALFALSCCTSDAHVGCSPTPSCNLNDARFKPAPVVDAGAPPCSMGQRCRATAIAVGGAHACGIAGAHQLFCWGSNEYGQLGRASGLDAGVDPSTIAVLDHVRAVAAGGAHTCALTDDAGVRCFGRDFEGQVSGMAEDAGGIAMTQPALDQPSSIVAGAEHSCALTAAGVMCWGSAEFGQVGREVMDGSLEPGIVPLDSVIELAAGYQHTCARLANGHVACWGELTDPDTNARYTSADPVEVPDLDDAIAISAGAGHSCALRNAGPTVCWGQNASGQLGDGTTEASGRPVTVVELDTAIQIAAGGGMSFGGLVGHTCAVDRGAYVWCWGRNAEGQLGVGEASDSSRPLQVRNTSDDPTDPYLGGVVAISVGGFSSCALDQDGPVLCWGDNSQGQLDPRDSAPAFGRAARVAAFGRRR